MWNCIQDGQQWNTLRQNKIFWNVYTAPVDEESAGAVLFKMIKLPENVLQLIALKDIIEIQKKGE